MNKLMFALLFAFIVPNSFASELSNKSCGGTVIFVPGERLELVKSRVLFEYGLEQKGLSKSEREYREFLSAGKYSKLRTVRVSSYGNVGRGRYASGRSGGKVIASKPFNPPRAGFGNFATISRPRIVNFRGFNTFVRR